MPELPSLSVLVPFIFGWMVSMGVTTSSAISMEGKSLWIIKSLPVSARDWLAAKIKVTLLLAIPSILIASTLVVIGLKPGIVDAIWMYLVPLAYTFAFSVFGLWLNIRMPRLDWQSEAEAIKQGGATMVCVFVGMAAGFAPAIVAGLTGSSLIAPIMCALLIGFTLWMWGSLVRSGENRMLMLH
jgi:ABC-2 type transport system permease protein